MQIYRNRNLKVYRIVVVEIMKCDFFDFGRF
jgi:hypothetical protein